MSGLTEETLMLLMGTVERWQLWMFPCVRFKIMMQVCEIMTFISNEYSFACLLRDISTECVHVFLHVCMCFCACVCDLTSCLCINFMVLTIFLQLKL